MSVEISDLAYGLLIDDYRTYHLVFVVGGTIFAAAALAIAVFGLSQLRLLGQASYDPLTAFERRTFTVVTVVGIIGFLAWALLVWGNLGNTLNPRLGFESAINSISGPAVRRSDLHGAVIDWLYSDNEPIPQLLERAIQDRQSWQRPKAVWSTALLIVLSIGASALWTGLIRRSRQNHATLGLGWRLVVAMGYVSLPLILLLLVLALANTQATLAPVLLTILAG